MVYSRGVVGGKTEVWNQGEEYEQNSRGKQGVDLKEQELSNLTAKETDMP